MIAMADGNNGDVGMSFVIIIGDSTENYINLSAIEGIEGHSEPTLRCDEIIIMLI